MRGMPTSYGLSVGVAAVWGAARSRLTLELTHTGHDEADATVGKIRGKPQQSHGLRRLRLHVGSCAVIVTAAATFTGSGLHADAGEAVEARCEEEGTVAVLEGLVFAAGLVVELEVAH